MASESPDPDPAQSENAWAQEIGYGGEEEEDQEGDFGAKDKADEQDVLEEEGAEECCKGVAGQHQ